MLRQKSAVLVAIMALIMSLGATLAHGQKMRVTVIVHEVYSVSDDDGSGDDDLYCKAWSGEEPRVTTDHIDDENHVWPEWKLPGALVDPAVDPIVAITLELWDHDSGLNGADDHFDIHPGERTNVEMVFNVATNKLKIPGLSGWEQFKRPAGKIKSQGSRGDDHGYIVFSVSASLFDAPNGDSDNDGLYDSWEINGLDADQDGFVDVDLPAMGADPYRKDVFVEIDWMVDGTDHCHAPWLPALINAWEEFDRMYVTNPNSRSGIALHIDVGDLYAGYAFDADGKDGPEIDILTDGMDLDWNSVKESIDLDGDGIPDIGMLGALGRLQGAGGTPGGGNVLFEVAPLLPFSFFGFTDFFLPGSSFDTIKMGSGNFAETRKGVFRYCLFAHDFQNNPGWAGLAECPCQGWTTCVSPCDDFIVALGGVANWGRQTLDVDRNGIPDPLQSLQGEPHPYVIGPYGPGVPVHGSVGLQTAAFMHELGHTLGLDHGGGDSVNYKPNYLSIMNYFFAFTGVELDSDVPPDGRANRLEGWDLNHDGAYDWSRFQYSSVELSPLNEGNLDEAAGIGDGQFITKYGPWDTGAGVLPRLALSAVGNEPIDWSRGDHDGNGITNDDVGVNTLTSPPNPVNTTTDLNNDGIANDGVSLPVLMGFDDVNHIKHTVLAPNAKFIDRQEQERLVRNSVRVTEVADVNFILEHAQVLHHVTFEPIELGFGPFQDLTDEYYTTGNIPVIFETAPGTSKPRIVGPTELLAPDGFPVSTQSGTQALMKEADSVLVMRFPIPQRLIGMYVGRLQMGDRAHQEPRAVLKAFDVDGFQMYKEVVTFPPQGITQFVGLGAVFGHQPIYKVELHYENGDPLDVYIDDLLLCPELIPVPVEFPPPPQFGDGLVAVEVKTEASVPAFMPLIGIPIMYNGQTDRTAFTFTTKEGTHTNFEAPAKFEDWYFLHWRMDDAVYFPRYQNNVSLDLLYDTKLTAVYSLDPPRIWAQVTLGPTDVEDGIANTQRGDGTDGENEAKRCGSPPGPTGDWRSARSNWGNQDPTPDAVDNYMYFRVLDPSVGSRSDVTISAYVYEDASVAGRIVALYYTNYNATGPLDLPNVFALHPTWHTLGSSNSWVRLQWTIQDAGFDGLMQNTSDFRLSMSGRICVDAVTVSAPLP